MQRHISWNTKHKTSIINDWDKLRPEFPTWTPGFLVTPPRFPLWTPPPLSFQNELSCLRASLPRLGTVQCNHLLVSVPERTALLQLLHIHNLYHEWSEVKNAWVSFSNNSHCHHVCDPKKNCKMVKWTTPSICKNMSSKQVKHKSNQNEQQGSAKGKDRLLQ